MELEAALLSAVCGQDFTFNGKQFLAKIVDYYDGDTVRAVFMFGDQMMQYKCRMIGYDSPEMKPLKSNPDRLKIKADALTAKKALIDKIGDELVTIECGEFDKYGRILVTIILRSTGENINQWMLDNQYGVVYNGGAKI